MNLDSITRFGAIIWYDGRYAIILNYEPMNRMVLGNKQYNTMMLNIHELYIHVIVEGQYKLVSRPLLVNPLELFTPFVQKHT